MIRCRRDRRHLDAVEVVHSQDGAPLVLVADEAETFGLACFLVTHQVDVHDLSIPVEKVGGDTMKPGRRSLFTAADCRKRCRKRTERRRR